MAPQRATIAPEQPAPECPQCGSSRLAHRLVKSSFWHEGRLVVVENIPAIVCDGCGERFFEDWTATTLDLMRGEGFLAEHATGHVQVPVFSFAERVPPELQDVAEEQQ